MINSSKIIRTKLAQIGMIHRLNGTMNIFTYSLIILAKCHCKETDNTLKEKMEQLLGNALTNRTG